MSAINITDIITVINHFGAEYNKACINYNTYLFDDETRDGMKAAITNLETELAADLGALGLLVEEGWVPNFEIEDSTIALAIEYGIKLKKFSNPNWTVQDAVKPLVLALQSAGYAYKAWVKDTSVGWAIVPGKNHYGVDVVRDSTSPRTHADCVEEARAINGSQKVLLLNRAWQAELEPMCTGLTMP